MERITLKDNREILRDMGLKMPAITPKYWSAIQKLSARDATSTLFYHIAAARNGQQVFYNELKSLGYAWGMFGIRVHVEHNMNTFMLSSRSW